MNEELRDLKLKEAAAVMECGQKVRAHQTKQQRTVERCLSEKAHLFFYFQHIDNLRKIMRDGLKLGEGMEAGEKRQQNV